VFKSHINFIDGVESEAGSQNSLMSNSTCSPIQVNKFYFQDLLYLASDHRTLEDSVCYQIKVEHF